MQVDHTWNNAILRTLAPEYATVARRHQDWEHLMGNLYKSSSGELHTCDATCIRWVYRADGMKICAITGICKNSRASAVTMSPVADRTKRRAAPSAGPPTCPEDAIASATRAPFDSVPPSSKRRTLRSAPSWASEDTDTDMSDSPSSATASPMAASGPDHFEASYGASNFQPHARGACGCPASGPGTAASTCGMHF